MERNVVRFKRITHAFIFYPSNALPGQPENTLLQICNNTYTVIHQSIPVIAQDWTEPKCPSTEVWMNKVHTSTQIGTTELQKK